VAGSLNLPKSRRADVSDIDINWDESSIPVLQEMGVPVFSIQSLSFYRVDKILPALKSAELRAKLVADGKAIPSQPK
jgi:hypothetical protein